MKQTLLAALLLVMTGIAATGQNSLPDNFHLKTLKNGLEVLVIEDPSVPLATIEIVVRNGAYCEPPEYDGLSHLYEHMFFKANKDYPSQEAFMDRVNELGVSFNGTTSNERVNYFITLSSEKLVEGLQFMNSAIRYPLFLEEEQKKENPVVDGEFQRAESNPVFFLLKDMDHQLWGDLYSRKNTIGDHDIIMTATKEKMITIKDKYYHPNNSMLVVAGAVSAKDVFKQAETVFGDWPAASFDPFEKWPIPEFPPLEGDKPFITISENAQLPIVMYSYHGPDTRNDLPATYAADVFSFVLQQASSKLQQEMVDAGLALQVGVSYSTLMHVGPIQIFLVPNPMRVDEAIAALETHIAQWDDPNYFTDEQLENAKTMLAIEDAYGKEKTSDFVHTVTYWWASASIDYYINYVDNLKKVTRADIQRYVQTYIKDKPRAKGILLSPEMRDQMLLTKLNM
ncbi:MAG: insulinase family protein [Bacteroidetes bacterium]|nr:insulinase family protein [Bacteroidota bacterium]